MSYTILTNDDLTTLLTTKDILPILENTLRANAEGKLVAPPRFEVGAEENVQLVFTAGAETKYEKVIGFRVYDSLIGAGGDHEQLTAVFDNETGAFKGLIIGDILGGIRTGGLGGVAVKFMARPDVQTLGILGTGFQAQFQLEAAAAVRDFDQVKVYSRTRANCEAFAQKMGAALDLTIEAASSAEAVVRAADVLICATYQDRPIFDAAWLKAGTHVTTIGPKFKDGSEIPFEVVEKSAVIATDSPAQTTAYRRPFFLLDTPHQDRLRDLGDIVAGKQVGRTSPDDITLFCSVGLAGTEVVVANEALRRAQ